MAKIAYQDRTDLQKLESQWRKLSGLHSRAEWSAAVVRAATAAEIAANLAIRAEFRAQSQVNETFVNAMLLWANGLKGKLDRLLLPLVNSSPKHGQVSALLTDASVVNDRRNLVVHRGEFCNQCEAEEAIAAASRFVEGLLSLYEPEFCLRPVSATVSDRDPTSGEGQEVTEA